jgi:hypothetical protein
MFLLNSLCSFEPALAPINVCRATASMRALLTLNPAHRFGGLTYLPPQ